jgi:hypothetical protein
MGWSRDVYLIARGLTRDPAADVTLRVERRGPWRGFEAVEFEARHDTETAA